MQYVNPLQIEGDPHLQTGMGRFFLLTAVVSAMLHTSVLERSTRMQLVGTLKILQSRLIVGETSGKVY